MFCTYIALLPRLFLKALYTAPPRHMTGGGESNHQSTKRNMTNKAKKNNILYNNNINKETLNGLVSERHSLLSSHTSSEAC